MKHSFEFRFRINFYTETEEMIFAIVYQILKKETETFAYFSFICLRFLQII